MYKFMDLMSMGITLNNKLGVLKTKKYRIGLITKAQQYLQLREICKGRIGKRTSEKSDGYGIRQS